MAALSAEQTHNSLEIGLSNKNIFKQHCQSYSNTLLI